MSNDFLYPGIKEEYYSSSTQKTKLLLLNILNSYEFNFCIKVETIKIYNISVGDMQIYFQVFFRLFIQIFSNYLSSTESQIYTACLMKLHIAIYCPIECS